MKAYVRIWSLSVDLGVWFVRNAESESQLVLYVMGFKDSGVWWVLSLILNIRLDLRLYGQWGGIMIIEYGINKQSGFVTNPEEAIDTWLETQCSNPNPNQQQTKQENKEISKITHC